jgi:hypothetical protein
MPIPSGYTSGQVVQAVPSLSAYAVTSSTRPASPFDGQIISETDTDTLKVYNGTSWIGVGGLVPMVPTSVAVGSGTGTANTLGQVTYSGASSVSLNGVFTSTYRNYKVVGQMLGSAGLDLFIRLRASGSDNSTANSYTNQISFVTSATVSAEDLTSTSAKFLPNASSTLINTFSAEFFNPQIAAATGITTSAISNQNAGYWVNCGIIHDQTVSYDGFTFLATGGTITGTLSVYGYNQ